MIPTRLFDAIDYQQLNFSKKDMLVHKSNGHWQSHSTLEVGEAALKMAAGLHNLGISARDYTAEGADKVAIISENRPEWIISDLAVQQVGAVLVPIYPTTPPEELFYIFKEAEIKMVLISSPLLFNKYQAVLRELPSIQYIYSFDQTDNPLWSEIQLMADQDAINRVQEIKAGITGDHLATIIYTSGTTGQPKGVMLSHSNILSCAMLAKESFPFPDNPTLRALSFLPLNHIFEKCISYVYMFSGISIYFAEGMEKIGENIKEIKPHIFMTVPRLLEKVFEKINKTGQQLQGTQKKVFNWSIRIAERYDNQKWHSPLYKTKLRLAQILVFSKWQAALGGEILYIITGGAACPQRLLRIFNAACIPVYEGYGPTENSPVIAVNRHVNNENYIGTVGPVIDGLEFKLEEDGEICVKGPTVMQGYYKQPTLTAETVIDGWLHTGDIGTLIEGSFLKITDRKKELFKTSGGKYVAPQPIENKLKELDIVEQAIIVGAEQKYVGALIVPNAEGLKDWATQNNLPYNTLEQAIALPEIKKLFKDHIQKINQTLSSTEQIKKHMLLTKPWSIDAGELTPKLSVRRKVVLEKYKDAIARLFN
ncbi:long-chain fatty acid--CoA ligase [Arachidicoccus ginsenosidivorans]|uniref:Long-chain fatty acid--CoA ligase n=1 Tax=Arachidicoccus ginsenosidivorans TaxID=496057 RepID=A0A5B8VKN6_9BACT|nr:long-chain fatty acid--CoA ligase [Arachidicoccus ginsenosidivorans]QEC71753.1 long-chain fatty acid--CoA ligase [Arachidicoccus ginsenosidivorans]